MKIKEGEKCYRYSSSINRLVEASLQCEEGLVCGDSVGDDEVDYRCQKTITTPDNLRYCDDDDDCGYDATCECNDEIGKNVCVPVPSSSQELKKLYTDFQENWKDLDAAADYYEYLMDNHLYIDSDYRCQNYLKGYGTTIISATSALKASALATIALAFLALF